MHEVLLTARLSKASTFFQLLSEEDGHYHVDVGPPAIWRASLVAEASPARMKGNWGRQTAGSVPGG